MLRLPIFFSSTRQFFNRADGFILIYSINNIDSFDDLDEYDNSSNAEKLFLHGKMSLYDILNSEITLNIYSVRLKNRNDFIFFQAQN